MIFEGTEKYMKESFESHTRGHTFHVTMTYFWVQIVHLGIATSTSSSVDKFPVFLLLNPYVVDENLWEDYYSADLMMSPAAKVGMVMPDKKPLPNLVVRDTIQRTR